MNKIVVEQKDSIYDIKKAISSIDDDNLIIHFRKGNKIYQNSTNLEIIKKSALQSGKKVQFEVEEERHKDFIEAVNNDISDSQISSVDIEEDALDSVKKDVRVSMKDKLLAISFLSGMRKKEVKPRKSKLKYLIIGIISIFIIGGIVYFAMVQIPSATVKLNVESDVLIKLVEASASTSSTSISKETASIPALKVEVTESDFITAPATGEKESGEFAKGKITIFNKTDKKVELNKGTKVKLISGDKENLVYELVKDVEIKEQEKKTEEGDTGEVTSVNYGSEEVDIIATAYGEKYNIEGGEKFEVDDYDTDEVVGENEDDIKGGSVKKVKVVTEADLNKLKTDLETLMKTKVKESLDKKTVNGQVMNEATISYEKLSEEFDKKLDEEAENITLKMQMRADALAYKEEDLDELVSMLVVDVVPPEYKLDTENPEYEVAVAEVKDDGETASLQIKLRGSVTPNIDQEKLKSDMIGLSIQAAQSYLDNLNNVTGYEIVLSPKLPAVIRKMPSKTQNIVVVINEPK